MLFILCNLNLIVTELELSDKQRENICLTYIEDLLLSNGRSLHNIVNMPVRTNFTQWQVTTVWYMTSSITTYRPS